MEKLQDYQKFKITSSRKNNLIINGWENNKSQEVK